MKLNKLRIGFLVGYLLSLSCVTVVMAGEVASVAGKGIKTSASSPTKLSWFIPDGVRADPNLFRIFQWADEGKLPNIKRMMSLGSYGYSIPVFPSHTPTNFAALLTGTYPQTNGVADGPMRVEGQLLAKPSVGGFSSTARTVPAIWSAFAKDKRVVLISLPGSTPPEFTSVRLNRVNFQ
jgi:predicted AlkP superfamily phosphohydrolase/phosphomutase